MMVDVTYQMVLSTLQTAGLLVGIFYYITTLRNAQKNRMVDLVFRRMQSSDTEYQKMTRSLEQIMTGWDTVEEFYTKYGYSTEPELTVARVEVQNKLRSWGFLLKEGAVDLDFITRVHSPWYIIRFWECFSPIIFDARERMGVPDHLSDLEYLYNAVKKKYPKLSLETVIFERAYLEKEA